MTNGLSLRVSHGCWHDNIAVISYSYNILDNFILELTTQDFGFSEVLLRYPRTQLPDI